MEQGTRLYVNYNCYHIQFTTLIAADTAIYNIKSPYYCLVYINQALYVLKNHSTNFFTYLKSKYKIDKNV